MGSREIGGEFTGAASGGLPDDPERRELAGRLRLGRVTLLDVRPLRLVNGRDEPLEFPALAFDDATDRTVRLVPHPTGHVEPRGDILRRGPKEHALYAAVENDLMTDGLRHAQRPEPDLRYR